MRVYISGKIGEAVPSRETLAKFKKAEDQLRGSGFEVFNPTTSGLGQHAESLAQKNGSTFWEEIVLLDLEELKRCDAIYMLEDFHSSDGALSEYWYAQGAGKSTLFECYGHAEEWIVKKYRKLCGQGLPPLQRENGENDNDVMRRYIRKNIDKIWLPISKSL